MKWWNKSYVKYCKVNGNFTYRWFVDNDKRLEEIKNNLGSKYKILEIKRRNNGTQL